MLPFGDWEGTGGNEPEARFRFPAPDDPAPGAGRLLAMALYASVLGVGGAAVGLIGLVKVIGGAPGWYLPALALFGLTGVALVVGAFLSIHQRALPWRLLLAATGPLVADILITALV